MLSELESEYRTLYAIGQGGVLGALDGACFILHLIPQLVCKVHEIHDDALGWGERRAIGPSVVQTGDAWHWLEQLAVALFLRTSRRCGGEPRSRVQPPAM
jgi:hypothetical protein